MFSKTRKFLFLIVLAALKTATVSAWYHALRSLAMRKKHAASSAVSPFRLDGSSRIWYWPPSSVSSPAVSLDGSFHIFAETCRVKSRQTLSNIRGVHSPRRFGRSFAITMQRKMLTRWAICLSCASTAIRMIPLRLPARWHWQMGGRTGRR